MKVIRAGLIRDSGFLPPVNVFGLGGIIYAPYVLGGWDQVAYIHL